MWASPCIAVPGHRDEFLKRGAFDARWFEHVCNVRSSTKTSTLHLYNRTRTHPFTNLLVPFLASFCACAHPTVPRWAQWWRLQFGSWRFYGGKLWERGPLDYISFNWLWICLRKSHTQDKCLFFCYVGKCPRCGRWGSEDPSTFASLRNPSQLYSKYFVLSYLIVGRVSFVILIFPKGLF